MAYKTPATARDRQRGQMGRSKWNTPLTTAEQRMVKKFQDSGRSVEFSDPNLGFSSNTSRNSTEHRTKLTTRRPAKSDSSILHAILFCVLVVIVVSWALGY